MIRLCDIEAYSPGIQIRPISLLCRSHQNHQTLTFPAGLYTQNHCPNTESLSLPPQSNQAGAFSLELTITIRDPHQCSSCSFLKKGASLLNSAVKLIYLNNLHKDSHVQHTGLICCQAVKKGLLILTGQELRKWLLVKSVRWYGYLIKESHKKYQPLLFINTSLVWLYSITSKEG